MKYGQIEAMPDHAACVTGQTDLGCDNLRREVGYRDTPWYKTPVGSCIEQFLHSPN